jgi:hypothetical protein
MAANYFRWEGSARAELITALSYVECLKNNFFRFLKAISRPYFIFRKKNTNSDHEFTSDIKIANPTPSNFNHYYSVQSKKKIINLFIIMAAIKV